MSSGISVNGEFEGIIKDTVCKGKEHEYLKDIFGKELIFKDGDEEFKHALDYPDEYLLFDDKEPLKVDYRYYAKDRRFKVHVWGNFDALTNTNPITLWAINVAQKLGSDLYHVLIIAKVDGGRILNTWAYLDEALKKQKED